MKVCIVVLNSIWYDPRVRKQIVEYNAQKDVDLCCVGLECFRYDEDKINLIPCETNIVIKPLKYKGKLKTVFGKLIREKKIINMVRDAIIAKKPDIIHANDLDALIPAYMASKKLKCKLIYDSHEINIENVFYMDKKLYKKVMEIRERRICQKIHKMICVSNAAADYFVEKYKIDRPMVITNCTLKKEQQFNVDKNEYFEILNHGQFYEGRGYDIMVEALPLLKKYSDIKIALRGFGKLENSLRKRAKELGDDNFIIYPPVSVEELIREAASSKVGVAITENICLNFELSVSNKIFEYAAAGLPVIMSDIPEHRYLNDKYKFGVILKDNTPQCFAEAVIKLYSDKEFYDLCSKNAKILSNEINWENQFKQLIEYERKIMEK